MGYINGLVEHNNCKVIILANQKEMKNLYLDQKKEEKVLSIFLNQGLSDKRKKIGKADGLQEEIEKFYGEDKLYLSVREKVIGIIIHYDAQIGNVYDAIISDYIKEEKKFKNLDRYKDKILKCFEEQKCNNLRTLILTMSIIKKVYNRIWEKNIKDQKLFEKIMESFVEYIAYFMIDYKNGEGNLKLNEEVKYIKIPNGKQIRGFKFLEDYCESLYFSQDGFEGALGMLTREYDEENEWKRKTKEGLAHTLDDLEQWWRKEDDDVKKLIDQLESEIKDNKYPHYRYSEAISLLVCLRHEGFDKIDIQKTVDFMKKHIENESENDNFFISEYSFDDEEAKKEYDGYIFELQKIINEKKKTSASEKDSNIKKILNESEWAEKFKEYCKNTCNLFLLKGSLMKFLPIEALIQKIRNASVNDYYFVTEAFQQVYNIQQVGEVFAGDLEDLKKFTDAIKNIGKLEGINKPKAKKHLENYLDKVIDSLSDQ